MSRLSLSRDGRRAIGATQDRSLVVWDAETGIVLRTLTAHIPEGRRPPGMNAIKMSADGSRAIASGTSDPLILWDVASGSILGQIENRRTSTQIPDYVAGGARAVLVSGDVSRSVIGQITDRKICPDAADLSADGRRAVLKTDDKEIVVVDFSTGHTRTMEWQPGSLKSVALTADGRRVVVGTDYRVPGQGYLDPDKSPLLVWDLETDAPPRRLDGHGGGITGISLSADGRRAATCALDREVIYWDLDRGTVIRRLTGHKEWLSAVALSPDERYAVSGGADRKMILWDLESGEAVTWLYLNGAIAELDWAGKRIAVFNGLIHFLEMEL